MFECNSSELPICYKVWGSHSSVMYVMYVVCVVSPDMGKDTQSIYYRTQTGWSWEWRLAKQDLKWIKNALHSWVLSLQRSWFQSVSRHICSYQTGEQTQGSSEWKSSVLLQHLHVIHYGEKSPNTNMAYNEKPTVMTVSKCTINMHMLTYKTAIW
jgi:hypothetical protein